MTDQIIADWLQDWKQKTDVTVDKDETSMIQFADSVLANEDLFQAITHVLEECDRFRSLYNDVISTLFAFCRTSVKKLKLFTIEFVPSLVYIYLYQIHAQKKCIALETLLRGMFELEDAVTEDRVPICARIPNINLPSIYHDPGGVSTSWLSDGELDRLTAKTVKVIQRPNLVFVEDRVRAPQRIPLCTELWWIFNYRLPEIPKHAIPTFLKTISKLTSQGFNLTSSQKVQPPARIILSSRLLIEMVHTIYFSVYNGAPTLAEQVLEEALNRANHQLWADAMLVCNAVRNYLKSSELPLQVEPNNFKKSIITNASFRTKKLPEDIPIVEAAETIAEEGDVPTILSKSKSKLPHILAKMAKRNSVVVMNEEGDVETIATPPERKKSIDSTPV